MLCIARHFYSEVTVEMMCREPGSREGLSGSPLSSSISVAADLRRGVVLGLACPSFPINKLTHDHASIALVVWVEPGELVMRFLEVNCFYVGAVRRVHHLTLNIVFDMFLAHRRREDAVQQLDQRKDDCVVIIRGEYVRQFSAR